MSWRGDPVLSAGPRGVPAARFPARRRLSGLRRVRQARGARPADAAALLRAASGARERVLRAERRVNGPARRGVRDAGYCS